MNHNFAELIKYIHKMKDKYFPDSNIEVFYQRINKISMRIVISDEFFIDIYINTDTNRYDYSLIRSNERIFGYDNLDRWHYHPLNKLSIHISCKRPSLEKIFKEMKSIVIKINSPLYG